MGQKLAVVVGGGPAPGINGVISAVTFEAVKQGLEVIGIYDGFKWLSKGDSSRTIKLSNGEISRIHLRGARSSGPLVIIRPRAPKRWPIRSKR